MAVPEQLAQYAFKPGNPGGGRHKERESLQKSLDRLGFKLIDEAIALFRDSKTSNYVKWDILKELLQYQYAKQRNVTVAGPEGEQASIKISWDTAETAKEQFVNALETVESQIVEACTEDDAESSVDERESRDCDSVSK